MLPASHSFLLIDDDLVLCELMGEFFRQQGHGLEIVHDGSTGLARALEGRCDLVLLDVMLPVLDGYEVLRQIRRRSRIPVIMLTARNSEADCIIGLDSGADDYLPKPFGPEELLARIRAVLRRAAGRSDVVQSISIGNLELDPGSRTVKAAGSDVGVTAVEFDILDYLVRAAGRVVSRDELTALLYQRPSTPFERAIDVHISRLRRKLEAAADIAIKSVRGVGYQLSAGRS